MASLSNIPGLDQALAAIKQGSRDGSTDEDGKVRQTYAQLPHDREYRVTIIESKQVTARSGADGISITMEVTEGEYTGSRVWENLYFTGHPFQGQRLAVFLASAGASVNTIEESVSAIIGGKLVIALQEGNDPRYPRVRWVNIDQGQKLREGLKPKKTESTNPALTADAVDDMINQRSTPTITTAPAVTTPPVGTVTPSRPAGGIKLPGAS